MIKSAARISRYLGLLLVVSLFSGARSSGTAAPQPTGALAWPPITRETRPWTRWWWLGSAVESNSLTAELEAYRKVGLGGVEITPIYGVHGYEDRFVPFLSEHWVDLFLHTLNEAQRVDLGVDLATATGWPFGGPWVGDEEACKYIASATYKLKGGERLAEPIRFQQKPIVRTVGNQVYQLYGEILRVPGEKTVGSMENPELLEGARRLNISDLVEPISSNKNLQALALDQVRFPKPLPLQTLMAYSDSGKIVDLTRRVNQAGALDWTAPAGNWTLYALFQGWHGKMVERAAPGGEGNVIDHFSASALQHYLGRFDQAFAGREVGSLRAFFNDSYEVDDSTGQSDWTPRLFDEFQKRRGYDLREHLPALLGNDSGEKNARVLCDYRETISDLLLQNFTEEWRDWSHRRHALIRNQAHGSPANIFDLYAAIDIPETEGTDLLRIKFATSAAHVTGKKLVSSESATWLNEHFRSTLWDVKQALDRYFLGGVNHIFYHGTCYSPQNEPWPGWLFYAAVHFNPRNSWWNDFSAVNEYAARVQSFLQTGQPANDVLLYFPISDFYSERGNGLLAHFTGAPNGSRLQKTAGTLQARGFAFDFISDRQLQKVKVKGRELITGEAAYQTIVVPECHYLPLETLEKLLRLARQGARIVFLEKLPGDVPGFANLDARRKAFQKLAVGLQFTLDEPHQVQQAQVGKGVVLLGGRLEEVLAAAGISRETMVDSGLQFFRGTHAGESYYFIANRSQTAFDNWVTFQTAAAQAALFDPMRGNKGLLASRKSKEGKLEVYLRLEPGESFIVQTISSAPDESRVNFYQPAGSPQEISGAWNLKFVSGGPELPEPMTLNRLSSWTDSAGEAGKRFSGTAEYSIAFAATNLNTDACWLDFGQVRESAQVLLNGKSLGTLIGPPYRILISREELKKTNALTIRVSNLMANRIADLDRRNVPWKKFYNVNFPARLAENRKNGLFDASRWEPLPSGLLGPVTLTPVKPQIF